MTGAKEKLAVYQALNSLNQGFEAILADLRRLQEFPFFRRQLLRVLTIITEETRAWANFEIADVMHERELNDWTHFSRLHHDWEKRRRDPDDILLEAEALKEKRRSTLRRKRK